MQDRLKTASVLLLIAFALTACENPPYSLHPLYSIETVFFDSTLVGNWYDEYSDEGDEPQATVERYGEFGYSILWRPEDGIGLSKAYSIRLGDRTYIDLFGAPEIEESDTTSFPVMPIHVFARYEVRSDTLSFTYISDGNWESFLESAGKPYFWLDWAPDPNGEGEKYDDMLILPQGTTELQDLVARVWAGYEEEDSDYLVRSR